MEMKIMTPDMPEYPERLRQIKNKPKKLYYAGDISLLSGRCVSVVGSRTTNTYGRSTAEKIARQLAGKDVCVISGMARGIDTCVHKSVLAAGGKTAAVLGCGLDICYPPENRILMEEIEKKGLLLTEYEPGTRAEKYNFPNRNRIISGLSEVTVVVQARNRSGSLITAELAAEQGREVMAVPGNIDSQYNLGSNKLIKEGATPIISVTDILDVLGLNQTSEEEAKAKLSDMEYAVFSLLKEKGEMSIDEVCASLGKSPAYINPIIAVMEMKGFTFSEMGKIFLANM
ncbi:MAG: DNA-processing protein DprA [Firmicutes bacterium]|nr:DNA-processing protein DprA [Bacillota bacterium]